MTITVSSTDRRDGKALALFARCAEWQTGHTKDGRPFFAIPGSESGLFHMADQRECSCPDFQRARNVCKHVRAVRLWMAAYQTGAVAPKPRRGAAPADDRIVLTPAGATFLAEQHERSAPGLATPAEIDIICAGIRADHEARADAERRQRPQEARTAPIRRYEDVFPSCRRDGCQEPPVGRSGLCDDHVAEQRHLIANA